MTPQMLEDYLMAARRSGCMNIALKLTDLELSVTFNPDISINNEPVINEDFGLKPTPGSWKSGVDTLDMPFEPDASEIEAQ